MLLDQIKLFLGQFPWFVDNRVIQNNLAGYIRELGYDVRQGGANPMPLMLAAGLGSSIRVTARGPEATAALEAIERLVAGHFGEGE